MKPGRIALVIKPTLECNCRCVYCYALKSSLRMSSDSLNLVFRKVGQFSKSNGIHNISILWHGGEAMVMGPSFYREVRDLEKEYLGHARVDHSMQTNASMYRGETRETLSKLLTPGVVGGCFDPFHPTRPLASGRDSFRESLEGYYALKKD